MQRSNTLDPHVAQVLRENGMDEMFRKVRQVEEARELVEQGKLKKEVYDALVENFSSSVGKAQSKKNLKKKEKGILTELLHTFRSKEPESKPTPHVPRDKPIACGNLFKRGKSLMGASWKKRYCELHPRAILVFKNKTDRQPRETIILTDDHHVAQTDGRHIKNGSGGIDEEDDNDSVATNETSQNKKDMEHVFIVTDMESKHVFAASSSSDYGYWVHSIAQTIRKIMEEEGAEGFDQPKFLDRPDRDPQKIQEDFERRKQNYLQSQRKKTLERTKRKSFFSKKTPVNWEEEEKKWEREGEEIARIEIARKLLEQERENVKRLEEQQRTREEELERWRKFADEWKEQAESNRKKYEEAETRAEKARVHEQELEAQLALMQQMRAQNIEREEAIKAEHETTQQQLDNIKEKRRMSSHPLAMKEYEAQIAALQAKLAALQSALEVDLDGLDWDGTLDDAEEKMKACIPRLMSDNPKEAMDAQAEFDQWDKIIRNHADYKKREENKWKDWERENAPANEQALEEMRSIVPREVLTGVSEAFLKKRGLRPALAKRVMATKIFQFLWMDKETISKVHIADLNSRYVTNGLDIVELRAIYAVAPDEFQNDRDGSKKNWLDTLRNKLFQLTEKEKKGQLTRAEARNPAYRSPEENRAAAAANRPKGGGAGKKKPGVAKKVDTSKLNALFANSPGGPPGKKGPPGFPGAGGPPPHVLKMMQGGGGAEDSSGSDSSKSNRKSITKSVRQAGGSLFSSMRNLVTGGSSNEPAAPSGGQGEESGNTSRRKSRRRSSMFSRSKKPEMTEQQKLLAKDVRGMMDSVKENYSVDMDDFDEKNAPAFDFGGDYSSAPRKNTLSKMRAGEFSKGIEDGIENLCKVIKEKGTFDRAEGGVATMTFGELFEEYENISDMLVGLLMRAKKRKRVKYIGDMLFQGIHDSVKITLLHA